MSGQSKANCFLPEKTTKQQNVLYFATHTLPHSSQCFLCTLLLSIKLSSTLQGNCAPPVHSSLISCVDTFSRYEISGNWRLFLFSTLSKTNYICQRLLVCEDFKMISWLRRFFLRRTFWTVIWNLRIFLLLSFAQAQPFVEFFHV